MCCQIRQLLLKRRRNKPFVFAATDQVWDWDCTLSGDMGFSLWI